MTQIQSLRLPRTHAPRAARAPAAYMGRTQIERTHAPRARRRSAASVELIVWSVFTAATPFAIGIGMLGSLIRAEAGHGFGGYDVLFYVGLATGIAAGLFALGLGAWPWAASLVASPALIVAIGSVFDGDWVLMALIASPILVFAGILGVLVTARRATDRTWEL
ncbi:hypothetical protein LQ757_12180 [Agromyces sp. SYSU K20354]|uniref:hypothetical protein n=1 Tax=Agromyces cavernae TaxID=2898659 RepID=UPI001E6103D4|nr:hypothetical protein [Agromyces cavernae]MCD2443031.1 hypothetical protein [Agromyces cavernae]